VWWTSIRKDRVAIYKVRLEGLFRSLRKADATQQTLKARIVAQEVSDNGSALSQRSSPLSYDLLTHHQKKGKREVFDLINEKG
jgi:hypothetical protein